MAYREDFDWSASITLDRRLLDAVVLLEFLGRHEHPPMADWWDWLANASYQTVIEGTSYRERLSPHRALLNRNQGGIYIGGAEKVGLAAAD